MTTEQNVAEGVVVERTFDASTTRVWKALTDVDQMRQWYFDLKEFRAEVGFELNSWLSTKARLIIIFAVSQK